MGTVMPDNVNRIKRYHDDVPLFSRFQIEHQIESAHARQVNLPSGGAIVIDHTEALTAIDINSARSTRGSDIETTALNTNVEAADEIARQVRLRDLGGLIVIDFIDMESAKNQREVENRLRDALRYDRARVQTSKISRFGLLELSRQRLAPSLEESSYSPCPRCNGIGHIRGIESSALNILRIIQEEAMKDSSAAIHAQVPVDVATFLLNEKRSDIHRIESRLKVSITLIPNPHMETPHYTVNRLRQDDITAEHLQASYKLVEKPEENKPVIAATTQEIKAQRPQAAVKGITPAQPAPKHEAKKVETTSFFGKLFGWLFGSSEKNKPAAVPAKARPQNPRRERDSNRGERPEGAQQQGNRQRNKPRRDREEGNSPRPENNQQPKTQQQENRPERPPRQPRPANVEKPVLETIKPVAANEQNTEEGGNQGRKRGRRGGRRERERRDQLSNGQPNGIETGVNGVVANEISTQVVAVSAIANDSPVAEVVSHTHEITPLAIEPVSIEPVSISPEVVSEITTVAATDKVEPAYLDSVVTKPEAVEVAAEPVQIVTDLPSPPSITESLSEAGLVLIETDPNKTASTAPVPENREHAPRRRQRPREVYTAENNEPLVMIETQQHHQ